MRGICMDVANLLEEVAGSGDEGEEEPSDPSPAAQRFAQGVQAALANADALGIQTSEQGYIVLFVFPCGNAIICPMRKLRSTWQLLMLFPFGAILIRPSHSHEH